MTSCNEHINHLRSEQALRCYAFTDRFAFRAMYFSRATIQLPRRLQTRSSQTTPVESLEHLVKQHRRYYYQYGVRRHLVPWPLVVSGPVISSGSGAISDRIKAKRGDDSLSSVVVPRPVIVPRSVVVPGPVVSSVVEPSVVVTRPVIVSSVVICSGQPGACVHLLSTHIEEVLGQSIASRTTSAGMVGLTQSATSTHA